MYCDDKCLKHIKAYLVRTDGDVCPEISVVKCDNSIGFATNVMKLAKQCKTPQFGTNPEDEALVRQWIEYAICYANYMESTTVSRQVMKELNSVMATRSYFIGNKQTIADAVLYCILYKVLVNMSHQDKERYLNVSRWFNNMQQIPELRQKNSLVHFSQTPLYS